MSFLIQASSIFQNGEKRLSLELPRGTTPLTGTGTDGSDPTVLTLWRRNLAMILANKGTDWKALVTSLGDKLMRDTNEQVPGRNAFLWGDII